MNNEDNPLLQLQIQFSAYVLVADIMMAVEPLRDVTFGDATNSRLVSVTFEKKSTSQEWTNGDENRTFLYIIYFSRISARYLPYIPVLLNLKC